VTKSEQTTQKRNASGIHVSPLEESVPSLVLVTKVPQKNASKHGASGKEAWILALPCFKIFVQESSASLYLPFHPDRTLPGLDRNYEKHNGQASHCFIEDKWELDNPHFVDR
jgi:hypothetical protein